MIWLSLAALFSGALLPIAFSPLNIYGAAFILPAVLLYIWLQLSAKNAFWTGWLFGLGFFGTGTSWIYISIHQYGNASVPLAAVITFIFCAFLALFFGYSQLITPLCGLSPIFGVYGLSLFTTMISGALVLLSTKQIQSYKIIAMLLIF